MGDGSTGRDGRQYVGIDLHRRRSVIVRQDRDGNRLGDPVRINNDSESWDRVIATFGPATKDARQFHRPTLSGETCTRHLLPDVADVFAASPSAAKYPGTS